MNCYRIPIQSNTKITGRNSYLSIIVAANDTEHAIEKATVLAGDLLRYHRPPWMLERGWGRPLPGEEPHILVGQPQFLHEGASNRHQSTSEQHLRGVKDAAHAAAALSDYLSHTDSRNHRG